jgi:hypothetical protein
MTILIALLGLLFAAAPTAKRVAQWVDLTIICCNDDWASAGSNMAELLRHSPQLILIQEGKRAHYADLRDDSGRRLFPMATWGVHQNTSNDAIAGSVVIWRHDSVKRTAAGFTFAVRAVGLLTRYIAWLRALLGGRKVFIFSAHRPPYRTRQFWRPFDIALWARLRLALAARRLVIGGMDSNQHGGPPNLPAGLKWVAVGNSIDGFILSEKIKVVEVTELPRGTSDHHPVLTHVRVPV